MKFFDDIGIQQKILRLILVVLSSLAINFLMMPA